MRREFKSRTGLIGRLVSKFLAADSEAWKAYSTALSLVREAKRTKSVTLCFPTGLGHLERLPREMGKISRLNTLKITGTRLTDLRPISRLGFLETLDLSYNTLLTDVSNVAGLTKLEDLNLSKTGIRDIASLSGMNRLRTLNLSGSRISDLSPLRAMTRLQKLDISNTDVVDLAPLASMTGLRWLSLWNVNATDFSPLSGLVGLHTLDMWNTAIDDLSPLADLCDLESLDLSHTLVQDIAPLARLEGLKKLFLWGTSIQHLERNAGHYRARVSGFELKSFAAAGDLASVRVSVARGADIQGDEWEGPFHIAVGSGHIEVCRFLLSLDSDLLNVWASYDGCFDPDTPLGLAIRAGNPAMIAFLIASGADVRGEDPDWGADWIAGYHLCVAAEKNDVGTLRLLLDRGLAPKSKDRRGLDALDYAEKAGHEEARRLLLDAVS